MSASETVSPATQILKSGQTTKTRQEQVWGSGDYRKVAKITVPLAHELVGAVEPRPGSTLLDVATGTGHVALEAARQDCVVTAVDLIPEWADVARRRAEAEGLDVDVRVADAERLPFADDAFDAVVSAIGVMFAADQERAADELVRVCRAGGRIGVASWTPDGFVGQMLKAVGRHLPPPPGAVSPLRWGTEDGVSRLLGPRVHDLAVHTATVAPRFGSPEEFADFFLVNYGPTFVAASALDDDGRAALRDDLVQLGHQSNRTHDDTFVSDWEYLVVTAVKR
jgi:ubiquinone/menaquinone biosynthesis C-methylase UbiE